MKRIYAAIRYFLRERFSLSEDQDNEHDIVDAIRKGVVFKGVNIWMLIFATMIASVGLNVNSTAVVIGAMLISPLMGPLMGLGLGAGINDLQLVNKAFKNLIIAMTFSIITSAIYFMVMPVTGEQSELLARTSPAFWDVLIAVFGGLTGVLAGSSRDKGNAIPGVAIATALMPPLCTAGYGLAMLNFSYFFGALYLFFINSVMIGASTFLVVRLLNFKQVEYMEPARESKVRKIIYALVFVTIIPSIYLGLNILRESNFKVAAEKYLKTEFSNEPYYVINKNLTFNDKLWFKRFPENTITIYVGGYMDSLAVYEKSNLLQTYNLPHTVLRVKQGNQLQEFVQEEQIKTDELTIAHNREIYLKDSVIGLLNNEIAENQADYYSPNRVRNELLAFYPAISSFSISESEVLSDSTSQEETLVYIDYDKKLKEKDWEIIQAWLAKRLNKNNIRIIKE